MRPVTRSVALICVVALSLLSVSGAASARNQRGSAAWCAHHPKSALPACQKTGGGGSGGSPAPTNITVSPDPVTETGGSDVYAVISVATDPAYAEQTVEIVSGLGNRCVGGVDWMSNEGSSTGSTATAVIDDDGNATFTVMGAGCAAGSVPVIADVLAGTNPTYTATITIDPPAPTI
jgi:hypothetical protein